MSKERAQRLYNDAGELNQRARAILDADYGEDGMPQENINEVETLFDQTDAKISEAKRLERAEELHQMLNAPQNRLGTGVPEQIDIDEEQQRKVYRKALRSGVRSLDQVERRALQADDDEAGGYLVVPQRMAQELLKFVDDAVQIRQVARVIQLGRAESLGAPTMDQDFNDWEWTTELQTGSEDTVKPFGKRELRPHPVAKRIKINNKLIRNSTLPIEQTVRERLGYKLSVTQEKAYIDGNGNQRPLGLFVASADGISTSRDVTMSSATAFTADDLIDTKFTLKTQYQMSRTTRWMVSRPFVQRARKLKDTQGQYLWGPGLGPGQPNTIVDIPYIQSEFVPSVFTTGLYIGILGDMRFYWIIDSLQIQIQTLLELYAESNERGYIGRYEGDGAPVLQEAFVRLKLA